jgi:o-succinylbenzoate synthase
MSRTRLEVRPYAQPLAIPYRWSKGEQTERCGLLVRMDRDGATGYGEAAPAPHEPVDGPGFRAQCLALIEGLDPDADDFLQRLDARDPAPRLRCGLATAWLSLRAAEAGQPLSVFLANGRTVAAQVPINELVTDATPQDAVGRTRAAVERGQTTIKLKCTDDIELDVERAGAIRAAFPDIGLRLDPNEAWSLESAPERLQRMSSFDIDYIEQPVHRDVSLEEYARLRARSPIRIALDDSVRSMAHVDRILELGAADVLILKAQRLGGPDKAAEVVERAAAAGVDVTITASLETAVGLTMNLHVAALAPQPIAPAGLGTARFFAEDVGTPPAIETGHMTTPTAPGLGIPHVRSI